MSVGDKFTIYDVYGIESVCSRAGTTLEVVEVHEWDGNRPGWVKVRFESGTVYSSTVDDIKRRCTLVATSK
jgi:hypothetical protein